MVLPEIQKRLGRDARIVFDVGAETGRYTRGYLEMFPEAVVYAFEPAPEPLLKLREIAAEEPRLKIVPVAVLDEVGSTAFNLATASVYNSVLEMQPGWTDHTMISQVEVPSITLDAFCEEHGIEKVDVLKIDVQGAELRVLRGAVKILQTGVRVILCELEYCDRYVGQCWQHEVKSFLQTYDYRVRYEALHYDESELLFTDGVFTR